MKMFMKRVDASGEIVGLLLMLTCGPRNCEACSVTYARIVSLVNHEDLHVMYITESSKKSTKLSKAGGKSPNSARIVVLPSVVYDYLMERKEWIKRHILDHYEEIDDLYRKKQKKMKKIKK